MIDKTQEQQHLVRYKGNKVEGKIKNPFASTLDPDRIFPKGQWIIVEEKFSSYLRMHFKDQYESMTEPKKNVDAEVDVLIGEVKTLKARIDKIEKIIIVATKKANGK